MNQPLVSVVTPSFNHGRFIEETMRSVMNQDYPNVEHIVVDGESTDETLDILRTYEDAYNLRWISEPDNGQTDAINKGFEMAEGEIIGSAVDNLERAAMTFVIHASLRVMGLVCFLEVCPHFHFLAIFKQTVYHLQAGDRFSCEIGLSPKG